MNESADSNVSDQIVRATWLAPDLLLVLLQISWAAPSERNWRVLLEREGQRFEFGARWLDYSTEAGGQAPTWLLTLVVPPDLSEFASGVLLLEDGDQLHRLEPGPLGRRLQSPAAFALACRAELDPRMRNRLQVFLVASPEAHRLLPLSSVLAEHLTIMREILRDPLPRTELAPGSFAARLEEVTALDDYGFWLTGWIHASRPREVRLTAVSPEGARHAILPDAVTFHPRPAYAKTLQDDDKVSTLGFHTFVELEHPSRHPTGWVLELREESGDAVQDAPPGPVRRDDAKISELVLDQIRGESPAESVFTNLVLPALARLRGGTHEAQIEKTSKFGSVPASVKASIVIAVRRVDRIQDQLAQFVRDPELSSSEIIFVAPRIDGGDELTAIAEELHLLYGIPFCVMQLSRPTRRPRALNLGASVARSTHLVLMSGDVLPRTPGWVETMRVFYESSPAIAAVGPKLLYEDDSISHAGAAYIRRGVPATWRCAVEFAGLARTVRGASFPRPVDAVSDACMMVPAERFKACGGFSELYLGPGDEAGDLCMRLAEDEGEIWYLPDAELYNLDRPEAPVKRSPAGARFNDWLFTKRWDTRLAWARADYPEVSA